MTRWARPDIAGLFHPLARLSLDVYADGLIVLFHIFYYYLHGKKASLHKLEKGEKGMQQTADGH